MNYENLFLFFDVWINGVVIINFCCNKYLFVDVMNLCFYIKDICEDFISVMVMVFFCC